MAKDDIDVSDVDTAEKAKILIALKSERKLRQSAERELRDLKAASPLGESPSAQAITAHTDAVVKAELAKQGGNSAAKIAGLEKQLSETGSKLSQLQIKTAVKEAAVAEHMRPDGIEHAITLGLLELQADPQADGALRTKDGRDVAGFVEELKTRAAFLWPVSRGAGGRGSGDAAPIDTGSNPWAKGSFNLTAQSRIAREAPERARMLQSQAAAMTRN